MLCKSNYIWCYFNKNTRLYPISYYTIYNIAFFKS